ncbi:hypothetical protein PFLG_01484 [Plasmodium falciparum RAJ116]|uniref:Uncharacterized protein n=1 Tax=Plasmodium falciparum RAJ116 TaxID=580058 RepID=A0A0L0CX44_PLAFA|nr:hypothetical protein PFLG_01484 [Plasmodium falciparum RAJ116]
MAKSHLEIAKQLKHNSIELKEYFEDLYSWQNDIKKKEEKEKEEIKLQKIYNNNNKKNNNNNNDEGLEKNTGKFYNKNKGFSYLKRDCNSLDTYYKAWDKLNIDDIDRNAEQINKNYEHVNKNYEHVNTNYEDIHKNYEHVNTNYEDIHKNYEHVNTNYEDIHKNYEHVNTNYEDIHKNYEHVNTNYEDIHKNYEHVNTNYENIHKNYEHVHNNSHNDIIFCENYKNNIPPENIPNSSQNNDNKTENERLNHKREQKNHVDEIQRDLYIEKNKSSHDISKLNNKEQIIKHVCKAYDIYLAKNEEGKLNYQKKNYHRCLENYNDIINYIDYELKCDNIFIEIEKNCNNELHIEVISDNYNFDKKKEELYIVRTKTLINRSLVYQRLSAHFESIDDCSSVILFYNYFLPNMKDNTTYNIKDLGTMNIKNIIFKAYYLRGIARYKLRIYKLSLKDFKESKILSNDMNSSSTINIDNTIHVIEEIIEKSNVKKYIRRRNEYTTTPVNHPRLKPRKLTIEIIPEEYTKGITFLDKLSEKNVHSTKKEIKIFEDEHKSNLSNDNYEAIEYKKNNISSKKEIKNNEDSDDQNDHDNEILDRGVMQIDKDTYTNGIDKGGLQEENKKIKDKKKKSIFRNNYKEINNSVKENNFFRSQSIESNNSSITLSEESLYSNIENGNSPHLTSLLSHEKGLINNNINSNNNCCREQIKNKINFELLWNSNKIRTSFKNQIDILKTAFLEEGIFNFHLDKDMYVDILDALFKNKFLEIFQNIQDEERIKHILAINNDNNINNYNKKENNQFINYNDCIILIDILYHLTNFGKDNYIFLFIDKGERTILLNFLTFSIKKYKYFYRC